MESRQTRLRQLTGTFYRLFTKSGDQTLKTSFSVNWCRPAARSEIPRKLFFSLQPGSPFANKARGHWAPWLARIGRYRRAIPT
jgi:hypothetical protein